MKLLAQEKIRKLLLVCSILVGTVVILVMISLQLQSKEFHRETNKILAGIVGSLIEKYPEAEQDIIKQLSTIQEQTVENGMQILQKYGINVEEIVPATNLEQVHQKSMRIMLLWIVLLGILLISCFAIYLYRREKKIRAITEYLKEIEKQQYSLKIQENEEGELSYLQNEIYKITVMLKESAQKLSQDKKYLSNALSDISHQIKTPLTSISVLLDILKENTNLPEEKRQEFLFEISRQIEWIHWLVISLLKLSKFDAGTVELKKETILIQNLIKEVIQNLSIPLEIKNQTIQMQGDPSSSFIGDFHWTAEAIINIIKNCMEHTEEGKTIQVSFKENALFTQIIIKDSGEGIAKEDLPYIFQRFYKGKNAGKDSFGIGLALAKAIIQNQGGDISVKSKKGEGTTFFVTIYKGIH